MTTRNWMIGLISSGILASAATAQTLPPAPGGGGGPGERGPSATQRGPGDQADRPRGPREDRDGPPGPREERRGPREDREAGPRGPRDGEGPRGPRDGEGPRGPRDGEGPRGPRDGEGPRGPRDGEGPGPGGPGGPGGRGGPGEGRRDPVSALSSYIELVDNYTELASNPSAAGVAAVVSLTEVMKPRGPEATITKLNEVLGQAKDPAVQRALRLQLIELYKSSNQADKAIEQAVYLITTSTPASE